MQREISRTMLTRIYVLLATLSVVITYCAVANAQTKEVIYQFKGSVGNSYDGIAPYSPLTLGPDGSLYGTTFLGGAGADYCDDGQGDSFPCGTVFQLRPPSEQHHFWDESVIYSFGSEFPDALSPFTAPLILDAAGNIYGVAGGGISNNTCGNGILPYWCGAVFQLVPPSGNGGPWTRNLLHQFQLSDVLNDGYFPGGGLVLDSKGALYGTTSSGGIFGGGTIFKLSPPTANGGPWIETILYNFRGGEDGESPESTLLLDEQGNLFGTTRFGGATFGHKWSCSFAGCGTAFELSPPVSGEAPWTKTILYTFESDGDGMFPNGLVFGKDGSLYGTTQGNIDDLCAGISQGSGCGTIFKLSPSQQKGTLWIETTLYRFTGGRDGRYPQGTLLIDSEGRLYGTTTYGGGYSGTVFVLVPNGDEWSARVIYRFKDNGDGGDPQSGLTFGQNGELFGTASTGGRPQGCESSGQYFTCGTVFEITK